MKRLILTIVLVALIATPALAVPTVLVGRTPGTYPAFPAGSGEYTLTPNAELGALIDSNSPFQSFCLEAYELVTIGDTYEAIINDEAIMGDGRWPVGSPKYPLGEAAGPDGGDLLDSRTAYLYCEFVKGVLPGYDYTPGPGRENSARNLQTAIWHLEQEVAYKDYNLLSPEAQAFVDLANLNDPGTIGCTRVLNLWENPVGNGKIPHQDMLVCIPEPATIGLLGLGALSLLRRKRSV
jgi:hypothetical protein